MKKIALFTIIIMFLSNINLNGQIMSLNFDATATGTITGTASTGLYQSGTICSVNGWEVQSTSQDATEIKCTGCAGRWAEIYYDCCAQSMTMVTNQFTPNTLSFNISFDYRFNYYASGDQFRVRLINVTDGNTIVSTLINNTTADANTTFSTTINLSGANATSDVYRLEYLYAGNCSWGASVDNILVSYPACTPIATFTQTCNTDLTYSVAVNVTSLGGNASVKLFNGTSNMQTGITTTGVPSGSPFTGYTGTKTFEIISESNASCKMGPTLNACTACNVLSVSFGAQSCQSDLTYDVPITITTLASGQTVKIMNGATNLITNITSTGTYTVQNLSGAVTLKVVDQADATCQKTSSAYAACNICALTTKPADVCANAPLINLSQPFYGSTNCSYNEEPDSHGADPDGPDAHCGSIENDSWLKFIAADDSIFLDWNVTGPAGCTDGIQLSVFDGTCSDRDAMIALACDNSTGGIGSSGTFEIPNMTIGKTYYLYIDGYAGDLCDYNFEAQGGIAVIPPNDTCPSASNVTCGSVDTASNILASGINPPPTCGGRTATKGVWYKIIGTGDSMTITTVSEASTNFTTEIFVYTGTCGALTCVGSDTMEYTFFAANTTTYTVYIDGYGTEQGQFVVGFACPTVTACNCTTPCVADGLFPNIDAATPLPAGADANCFNPSPNLGLGTYTTCHTVTTSAEGTLGLLQGMSGLCVDDIIATRTVELFQKSGGICSGSAIPADVAIADQTGNHSSTFNPEWYSLTPNTDYIACVSFTVNSGCSLDYACLEYYDASIPCNAIVENDFSTNATGWTLNGWTRGTNSSVNSFTTGEVPNYVYIVDGSSNAGTIYALSPIYNLTGYTSASFEFNYVYNWYSGSESFNVEYWNGTAWTTITGFPKTTDVAPWTNVSFDIPVAHLNANFQVRFGYNDGGGYNWYAAFDDFKICGVVGSPCEAEAGSWD